MLAMTTHQKGVRLRWVDSSCVTLPRNYSMYEVFESKYFCYVLIEVEMINSTVPFPRADTSHNVRIFISPGIVIVS